MSFDMSIAANWITFFFGLLALLTTISLVWMYLHDRFQTTHAVRRNFPIIGRMRYRMERLGEYFRQYFFAHDREEQPFNRATRAWIYRTAKGLGGMVGFGSTNDLREPGSVIFVNASFPLLEEECTDVPAITIGPGCKYPLVANNIFNLSAMSFGAISKPAVRALSRGAARAGIWMNTGEGGLSPYHQEGGGDLIYQIGTAKYGVRDTNGLLDDQKLRELSGYVDAFEIKLSQGAKPGRGGVLPAKKVTTEVANIRGIPVGMMSSSPNRHPDIGNIGELLDSIARIRNVTGRPVGFKAVMGSATFVRELCDEILKRGLDSAPDFITVDGGEGGTGAAPQVLIDHVGMPLIESLPMVVDVLNQAGLRNRIRIIASGKMVTSANVAWALCMGADFAVSARGFMFALGCIQSLSCHMDTCPTGITTHNKRLQKGLVVKDKAKRVAAYAHWVNHEVNVIAHSCGLHNAREFSRDYARIVQHAGYSMPLSEIYPVPDSFQHSS